MGTARSNQSILKETNPEYSLKRTDAEDEAPVLWPPDMKSQLTEKNSVLGKIEGRRSGQQRLKQLVGIIDSLE